MPALPLNPYDNNYLSCRLINQQLVQNKMDFTLSENSTVQPSHPIKIMTDGTGRVIMQGALVISGTPSTLMVLGTLPDKLKPTKDWYLSVPVLRGGASIVQNAVKVESNDDSVLGITVTHSGTYSGVPAIAIGSPGAGAIVEAAMRMKTTGATLGGGTSGGFVPGQVYTLQGGSAPGGAFVPATITVLTTQAQAIALVSGGTGGVNGPVTVTGTTGTGTRIQATGTISGGALQAVGLSLSVNGAYTANPTDLNNEPVTGGSLTGAAVSFPNTMALNTFSVTTQGLYGTLPANPIDLVGTGSGGKINAQWEVYSSFLINEGSGYDSSSPVIFSGGGVIGSDPATATLLLAVNDKGQIVLINEPQAGDTIFLDGLSFMVEPYL